jgi:hypothetical protein
MTCHQNWNSMRKHNRIAAEARSVFQLAQLIGEEQVAVDFLKLCQPTKAVSAASKHV